MPKKKNSSNDALKRAEIIIQVRSGLLTATEAAKKLGISRKNYYKWEKRALEAMLEAVGSRQSGRPSQQEDPEKQELKERLALLEAQNKLLQHRIEIRELMDDEKLGLTQKKRPSRKNR